MRIMVLVKANKDTEAGALPDERLLTEMGNYNEEPGKAGLILAMEGLHPGSKGARVRFSGAKRTVIDGIEIRQAFEAEGFGAAFTPELREQEERLRRKGGTE